MQQFPGPFLAKITFIAEQFADEVFGQGGYGSGIGNMARCQLERDDLMEIVEHPMKLEAPKPAHRSSTASGQAGKGFVAPDPAVVTPRKGGGVNVVEARFLPQLRNQERHQGQKSPLLQGDKALVARHSRKVAPPRFAPRAVCKSSSEI
jgi:hypothetical protein